MLSNKKNARKVIGIHEEVCELTLTKFPDRVQGFSFFFFNLSRKDVAIKSSSNTRVNRAVFT